LTTSLVNACEPTKPNVLSDWKGLLIFGEQRQGRIHPIVFELLGWAREIASKMNEPVTCALLGDNLKEGAKELVEHGADKVCLYDGKIFSHFREDPYAQVLASLAREVKPNIFLLGATATGRSLAPRIAARLGTGLTAECTRLEVELESRLLIQTRPAYGGNMMATIVCSKHRPQMATVMYRAMKEADRIPDHKGEITKKDVRVEELLDRTRIISSRKRSDEQISITDTDVIVSGGRGLADPKGFELLQQLADLLGGVVGSSRVPVDEGWISSDHQVGLSGRTVRPRIYIACGISGAVQHLIGMRTSDRIIAINKDPEAPIFGIADVGVVGDLYEIIPELIKRIKERTLSLIGMRAVEED